MNSRRNAEANRFNFYVVFLPTDKNRLARAAAFAHEVRMGGEAAHIPHSGMKAAAPLCVYSSIERRRCEKARLPLRRIGNRARLCKEEKAYKSSSNVPATIRISPISDFFDIFSLRKINEKATVRTILSLSIGTTRLASPSCKAL